MHSSPVNYKANTDFSDIYSVSGINVRSGPEHTHTHVSQLGAMRSQCSSVPIVNVSGPWRGVFSRARCVNTSSCVCVNGSMTWQRATCLTWCDLQDHPLARTNTAQSRPEREKSFYARRQTCGHRFSTCSQTPVRKRLYALTPRRHGVQARPSNWRQSGHFPLLHVWEKRKTPNFSTHLNAAGQCSSHLLAAVTRIKSLHKHAKENHFSSLIKQKCL